VLELLTLQRGRALTGFCRYLSLRIVAGGQLAGVQLAAASGLDPGRRNGPRQDGAGAGVGVGVGIAIATPACVTYMPLVIVLASARRCRRVAGTVQARCRHSAALRPKPETVRPKPSALNPHS
jgi:hypothetical protein